MAHTDNTVPFRLREQYGLVYHRASRNYLLSHHSKTKEARARRQRQARHIAKQQLRMGIEPAPYKAVGVMWDVL